MRNVQVRLTTDPPEARANLRANPELYDSSSGIITFPELSASAYRGDTTAKGQIWYRSGHRRVVKVRAEIIGSVPAEDSTKLDNNQAELWVNFTATLGEHKVRSNTSISAEVVNRSPAQGENHAFRVRASEVTSLDTETKNYDEDVAVKVELSEGLAFAPGHSAEPGTRFSRISETAGVWRLGDGARVTGELTIPVQLSAGDAPPLNRRCLSAQIVGGRPPATAHEHGKVHTECLGAPKPVIVSDGDVDITVTSCNAPVVYPCRERDGTVTLVARVRAPQGHQDYRPEDVIFLVDPVEHQSAGTLGDVTWSWSTGQTLAAGHGQTAYDHSLPGVRLTFYLPRNTVGRDRKWTIGDVVTPHERPGTIAIMARYGSGPTLVEALNPDKDDKLTNDISRHAVTVAYRRIVVFSDPGLYKVNFGSGWTRISDGEELSATSTLTFVVGDVADLQVHDAGLHATLPRGQRAYTLRAENNLERTAELVEVALTGVPRGAKAEVSEDGGRYERGVCDANGLCSGIWKIGDLEGREERYLSGRSDGPTLTLLVDGDPDPITATITSEQTTRVTAGGQTHTIRTAVLDESISKDVSVAVGTGRGERDPDALQSLRVEKYGSIAVLRWEPPEDGKVGRWPVSHYELERNRRLVESDLRETLYVDLRSGSGRTTYRVRAVSDQGVPGPWLSSAETAGLGAPTGLTAAPGRGEDHVALSWFAPSEEGGLSYRIEYAFDGAGPWLTLRSQGGTTYSHTGLRQGTTYFYRVAAAQGGVVSPWAYAQATTDNLGVNAPGWPENLRFTRVDRTAVTLAWDPPFDDGGSRVTGYEYRVFGPCASGSDAVCDIVAPRRVSGTSVSISGLNREGTYQFEVRVLNAAGAGEWSLSIDKEVGPAALWRVVIPARLTVREGGEATYRVQLNRSPDLPVAVFLHWMGDEDLGGNLPSQQGQLLLPNGYDLTKLSEDCFGYNYQDAARAYRWNVGVPITVTAAEDDDSEHGKLTIRHDVGTVPESCFETAPADYESKSFEVYDLALEVTERDND